MNGIAWWQTAGLLLVAVIALVGVCYAFYAAFAVMRSRRKPMLLIAIGMTCALGTRAMAMRVPHDGGHVDTLYSFVLPAGAWTLFLIGFVWLCMLIIEQDRKVQELGEADAD